MSEGSRGRSKGLTCALACQQFEGGGEEVEGADEEVEQRHHSDELKDAFADAEKFILWRQRWDLEIRIKEL